MGKVLIFARGDVKSDNYYVTAITAQGLDVEVLNPRPFDSGVLDSIESAGGVLLAGGGDMLPEYYGAVEEIPGINTHIDPVRDRLEMESLRHIEMLRKPIFAVCRGIQLLNCYLGGDLYQDIDRQFPPEGVKKGHQQTDSGIPRSKKSHDVLIEENSLYHRIFGRNRIRVNSTHHQALRRMGRNLKPAGHAPDGVVELAEWEGREDVLAVQFHPERLWKSCASMRKLFQYFAEVVGK